MWHQPEDDFEDLLMRAGLADIGERLRRPPTSLYDAAVSWLADCLPGEDAVQKVLRTEGQESVNAFTALFWNSIRARRVLAQESVLQDLIDSEALEVPARKKLEERLNGSKALLYAVLHSAAELIDLARRTGEPTSALAVAAVLIAKDNHSTSLMETRDTIDGRIYDALRTSVLSTITVNADPHSLPCAESIVRAERACHSENSLLRSVFLDEHAGYSSLSEDYDLDSIQDPPAIERDTQKRLNSPEISWLQSAIDDNNLDWPLFLGQPSTLFLKMAQPFFTELSELVARTVCCHYLGVSKDPTPSANRLLQFSSLVWSCRTYERLDAWFAISSLDFLEPELLPASAVEESMQYLADKWELAKREEGDSAVWPAAESALEYLAQAAVPADSPLSLGDDSGSDIDPASYFKIERGSARERRLLSEREAGGTRIDLSRLVMNGESELLEFKSSLRTNLHTGKSDPRIELAILKTIAAFLNTEGGTLIVGLSDDGTPLGLDADGFPNEDRMTLHLVNLVNGRMGPQIMTDVHVHFKEYNGVRVMIVRCGKAVSPVFVKDGNLERFYVRTGPSSSELSASQTQEYIRKRFG